MKKNTKILLLIFIGLSIGAIVCSFLGAAVVGAWSASIMYLGALFAVTLAALYENDEL